MIASSILCARKAAPRQKQPELPQRPCEEKSSSREFSRTVSSYHPACLARTRLDQLTVRPRRKASQTEKHRRTRSLPETPYHVKSGKAHRTFLTCFPRGGYIAKRLKARQIAPCSFCQASSSVAVYRLELSVLHGLPRNLANRHDVVEDPTRVRCDRSFWCHIGIVSAFCCLPFKTTSFIRFPSSTTGTLVTIRKCAFDAIKVVGFSL
jgi:hypothetical protein